MCEAFVLLCPLGEIQASVFAFDDVRRTLEIPFENPDEVSPLTESFAKKAGYRHFAL